MGVFGHGAGATAAAEAIADDARFGIAATWGASVFGTAASRGIRRPVLAFTVGTSPPSLDSVLRYGGTEVRLESASQGSLTDHALLGKPIARLLGLQRAHDPRDIQAAVPALMLRFVDQYLKDRGSETDVDLPSRVHVRLIPHQPRAR